MSSQVARILAATSIAFAVATFTGIGAAFADNDSGKVANTSSADTAAQSASSGIVRLKVDKASGITPDVTGSGGTIHGYHAVTITPPGGSAGTFNQGFTSHYSSGCGLITCTINVSSGSSYTHWLGSKPFNANRMSLTDKVWVGGTNISVSVGSSPSAGISVSNSTVTMSSAVSNTWRVEHEFYNIKFSTHIAMWGPYENSADSATFSWKTFYDNIN